MSADAGNARTAVVERVLHGHGRLSVAQRRAAFENRGVPEPMRAPVDKVTHHAWRVTDEDVAGPKAARAALDAAARGTP